MHGNWLYQKQLKNKGNQHKAQAKRLPEDHPDIVTGWPKRKLASPRIGLKEG